MDTQVRQFGFGHAHRAQYFSGGSVDDALLGELIRLPMDARNRFARADGVDMLDDAGEVEPVQVINGILRGEFGVSDKRYRLRKPMRVTVEIHQHDEVIARSELYPTVSGYGETQEEALDALTHDFIDTFCVYTLRSDDQLSQDARELKERLRTYVEEITD